MYIILNFLVTTFEKKELETQITFNDTLLKPKYPRYILTWKQYFWSINMILHILFCTPFKTLYLYFLHTSIHANYISTAQGATCG